jgi:hypothetical protein
MEKGHKLTDTEFNYKYGSINKIYYQIDCNTVRTAKCGCGMLSESNPKLPFFKLQPQSDYDSYYCGCMGWD